MAKVTVKVLHGAEPIEVTLENGNVNELMDVLQARMDVGRLFNRDGDPLGPGDTVEEGETVRATPKAGAGA